MMVRLTVGNLLAGILFLAVAAVPASAAPYTLDEDLKSLTISLREYPDGNGLRWANAKGVIGSGQQYVDVSGLSARSATEAVLLVYGLEDQATLTLAKDNWNQSLETCTTDETGMCRVEFKTHNDVGFKIKGSADTLWQLIVLTSPEADAATLLPSPLYAAEKEVAPDVPDEPVAAEPGYYKYGAIGLLVIIAVLLFVILRRRSGSVAAIVLLSLVVGGPHTDATADDYENAPDDETNSRSNPNSGASRADNSRGGTGGWVVSDNESETIDDLRGGWHRDAASERARQERIREEIERANKAYENIKKRVEALMLLKDLAGKWGDLSSCSAVSNPPNMPRIPSFCEGDMECRACYAEARGEFERVRGVLEQLRTIYKCSKDFTNSAVAFGDNASGVHAVTGLVWQNERRKIKEAERDLEKAYDQKYGELMGKLHGSMIEISVCEAYYGEPDWYDRFGFMYFEFVQDKYKRSN
jgi:hypothetical protein